jgi:hypothetical protein
MDPELLQHCRSLFGLTHASDAAIAMADRVGLSMIEDLIHRCNFLRQQREGFLVLRFPDGDPMWETPAELMLKIADAEDAGETEIAGAFRDVLRRYEDCDHDQDVFMLIADRRHHNLRVLVIPMEDPAPMLRSLLTEASRELPAK